MKFRLFLSVAAALVVSPALAAPAAAPLPDLIRPLAIPYHSFKLANGLKVIVHTDRRAPVVAVAVWYNVGSASEPLGKAGFAHLFEHLMFNGSENAPGDFFAPLKQMGATDFNGTTFFDRTNYFETVPTHALARALFLESDRMGWLLGAVTPHVLAIQRGVVQNEKRQGDNQPYGLVDYHELAALFPLSHPYAHAPIGSMKDLDRADLTDVKAWFRDHYGPNNAVLVLAGDIDAATARPLVERYFGAIARGPEALRVRALPMPLVRPVTETMADRVATAMVERSWPVPGLNDRDSTTLDVAAGVLGGLSSSRLVETLVRQEKLAVSASATNASMAHAGVFSLRVMVRPGVEPAKVVARLDRLVADFLATGPSVDEVRRSATDGITRMMDRFESVSEKAATLTEGELFAGDPALYRHQLGQLARERAGHVRQVAARWLGRPAYTLIVTPGPRETYDEAAPSVSGPPAGPDVPIAATRGPLPALGDPEPPVLPTIMRAHLSNGIEIVYARQTTTPFTRVVLSLDAGAAADPADAVGTQQMVLAMLDEGTVRRSAAAIAREQENLGASIDAGSTADRTRLSVAVPSANAPAALDLLADMVLHPAFAETELARTRDQQLASIEEEQTIPATVAAVAMAPLLYGVDSPYSRTQGSGDPAVVARLTSADLAAFHRAWFRPDKARLFVTSDRPLAEIERLLDHALGGWTASGPAGIKKFPVTPSAPVKPEVVLVDRPDSPQSYIMAGFRTALDSHGDTMAVEVANDALGGDFLSRLNMDLREDKHWTYGVRGIFRANEHAMPYVVVAPVQTDSTADAIAALREDMRHFLSDRPMSGAELDRTVADEVRSLPGAFARSDDVLDAMQRNALLGRPDDYAVQRADRVRRLTPQQVNAAIRQVLDPDRAIWVVVGDARKIGAQFTRMNLPWRLLALPASSSPVSKD